MYLVIFAYLSQCHMVDNIFNEIVGPMPLEQLTVTTEQAKY